MALTVNLRHLDRKDLHLNGFLEVKDLEIENIDELIQITAPVRYELDVQKVEDGILAQGKLHLELRCECSRCLKPFAQPLEMAPWICHLPLSGEDAVAIDNDCVDLTPHLREDILLAFPQHPLCKVDCSGLPNQSSSRDQTKVKSEADLLSSPWSELNKLKF